MKGLLIKDFKLLKNQKSFLAIVAAVCVFVMIKGSESYALFYGAAMAAMLSVNSIGYDEENNGMGFLFTLPVSRRDYVLEKYGFGLLLLGIVLAAGSVLSAGISAVQEQPMESVEWAVMLIGPLVTSAAMQSFMIPVQLKFGTAKGRTALLVVFIRVSGISDWAGYMAVIMHNYNAEIMQTIEQAGDAAVVTGLCLLAAAMMGISCAVSFAVMKKKQF